MVITQMKSNRVFINDIFFFKKSTNKFEEEREREQEQRRRHQEREDQCENSSRV
jgi:hypothetical protein